MEQLSCQISAQSLDSSSSIPQPSAIYIIVGAPRSGTSALTLTFQEQGIPMYLEADQPDLNSPSGNQEDTLVRLLHNQLMGCNALGEVRDWDNPHYISRVQHDVVQQIKAYIRCRSEDSTGVWGIKDPRLCFLIEPWNAATQGLRVHWIHIYREDRDAMINSLLAMLPAKLRTCCNDLHNLYYLVSNWAEAYMLAANLGFERTGINPFRISYEELLTFEGQTKLAKKFEFKAPICCIRADLNRQGRKNCRLN